MVVRNTVRDLLGNGEKKIILNLAEVNYIDSSGIGELVSTYTTVTGGDGQLKLLNLTKKIQELLAITKLLTVFQTFDDEQAALDFIAACEAQGKVPGTFSEAEKNVPGTLLAAYERAAQQWKDSIFWQRQSAVTARRLGHWRLASAAHERLARLDPENQATHLRAAVQALLAGGLDDDVVRLTERWFTAAGAEPAGTAPPCTRRTRPARSSASRSVRAVTGVTPNDSLSSATRTNPRSITRSAASERRRAAVRSGSISLLSDAQTNFAIRNALVS